MLWALCSLLRSSYAKDRTAVMPWASLLPVYTACLSYAKKKIASFRAIKIDHIPWLFSTACREWRCEPCAPCWDYPWENYLFYQEGRLDSHMFDKELWSRKARRLSFSCVGSKIITYVDTYYFGQERWLKSIKYRSCMSLQETDKCSSVKNRGTYVDGRGT
jgi:hypothetical protein